MAISGTHTHAGPGGYLQYMIYSVTSLGFVQQSFDAIVNAIEQSIIQAHDNLKPGLVFLNSGEQYFIFCLFLINLQFKKKLKEPISCGNNVYKKNSCGNSLLLIVLYVLFLYHV